MTTWVPVPANTLVFGDTVRRTEKGRTLTVTAVYPAMIRGRQRIVVESDDLMLASHPTAQWWRKVN